MPQQSSFDLPSQKSNMDKKVKKTFLQKFFRNPFKKKKSTQESKFSQSNEISFKPLDHARSEDTVFSSPSDSHLTTHSLDDISTKKQRSKSLAYYYNEKSTDHILLPDGRLVHSRSHNQLTIDTGFSVGPLLSPISPLTVRQRSYFLAQSGSTYLSPLESPTSSGPRLFVPEGGPKEAVVGRFTINRETIESSVYKPPALERKQSRFLSLDR